MERRMRCLNVGSGLDYKSSTAEQEWTNFDSNPETKPDLVGHAENLSDYFDENMFDLVELIHVWEHCEDLILVMEQIWHVLKPGGKLIVVCPYYTAENAFADPSHKHVITPVTYAFLSYACYEANAKKGSRMSQLFPKCDFDIKRRVIVPCNAEAKFRDEEFAIKHYFNVVEELQVELEAVKPLRTFDITQYQKGR